MFKPHCPRCRSSRVQLGFKDTPLALRLVGVQELLCNNCNLEFKGIAFGKLERARATHEESIANRRRAPRFQVKLPVTVAVVVKESFKQGIEYSPALKGHTRDLSSIGLALVLPEVRAGEYDLTKTEQKLWLKLELPTSTIVMRAALIRHEKLQGAKAGWVVGVHIRQMDSTDAAEFRSYLERLASSS